MDIEQTDNETAQPVEVDKTRKETAMENVTRYMPWLFPVSATVVGAALTLTTLGPWFEDFGINEAVGWGIAGLYDLFWLGSLYYERDAISSAKEKEAELYRNFGWGFASVATLLLIVHTIIKHPGDSTFGSYIEAGLPGYIAGMTPVLAKVMWMFVSIRFDNWIPAETKRRIRETRLAARMATAVQVATWDAEAEKYMATEKVQVGAKKRVAALQLELAGDASEASTNVRKVREILGADFAEEDLFQLPTELRPVPLPEIPVMMSRPVRKQISAKEQTRDVVSAPLSTNEMKAWAWRELIKLYHKMNDQLPVEERPLERQYFYTNLDTIDSEGKLVGFAQYLPEGVRDVLPTVITAGTFSKNFAKYPPSSFDDDENAEG